MKMYRVGGCVRDQILGDESKDIDFTVVLEDSDMRKWFVNGGGDPFWVMVNELALMGFKIFLESPEYLTARAQFPKGPSTINSKRSNLTADFVLARKESGYSDGRRPDVVIPGTLEDDLARRDFTMNAVAIGDDDEFIDPFNGIADIKTRLIRAVGDPFDRMNDDALRAVRAIRFSVTKGFRIDRQLAFAMETASVLDKIRYNISDERISEELSKMFRFDTRHSIYVLNEFPSLTDAMFAGKVSLDSTLKQRGRK